MRLLAGAGTPRGLAARGSAYLLVVTTADGAALMILTIMTETGAAALVASIEPGTHS